MLIFLHFYRSEIHKNRLLNLEQMSRLQQPLAHDMAPLRKGNRYKVAAG